jgi:SAM-dependent methyltransferase
MKQYSPLIYNLDKKISKDALAEFKSILDVGCGPNKVEGATGIDSIQSPGVDTIWNLDQYPWPFPDNHFDLIISNHAFEHLTDVVMAITECYRILKPNGRLIINVPYFRNSDAFGDVTHKHFFTIRSFDHFIKGTKASRYKYTDIDIELVGIFLGWPSASKNIIRNYLKNFINGHRDFYEQKLSYFYPVKNIVYELLIKK